MKLKKLSYENYYFVKNCLEIKKIKALYMSNKYIFIRNIYFTDVGFL